MNQKIRGSNHSSICFYTTQPAPCANNYLLPHLLVSVLVKHKSHNPWLSKSRLLSRITCCVVVTSLIYVQHESCVCGHRYSWYTLPDVSVSSCSNSSSLLSSNRGVKLKWESTPIEASLPLVVLTFEALISIWLAFAVNRYESESTSKRLLRK